MGTPSHYKNVHVCKLHIRKNDKYVSRSYSTKLATICNFEEESGTRGGGEGHKSMDCSRRRVWHSHVLATVAMQSTLSDGTMCTTS